MSNVATKMDTCITALLLRGRVYAYENVIYEKGVPVIVKDEALGYTLEDLYDEVHDSDGEVIEKPIFEIDFEAPFPDPSQKDGRSDRKTRKRRVTRHNEEVRPKKARKPRGSLAR